MTSKERLRGTLTGEKVDHLAAQPMLMMYAAKHFGIPFIDYTRDGTKMAEAQLKMAEDFGVDCLLSCSDPTREVIDITGEGSIDWFTDQGPVINEARAALADKSRFNQLKLPDPLGGGRMHDRIKSIEMMRQRGGPDVSVVGWIEGSLALSADLRGLNTIMVDFWDDPQFVRDIFDFTAQVEMRYATAQIDAGADTIGIGDAAASMVGPAIYAEFVFPAQLRLLNYLKDNHPQVIRRLHMCGNTTAIAPKMRELPVDIYEIDFPADLSRVRKALGPDRVVCGNVSTITDLLQGTPETVYEACHRCHEICGPSHIVGGGCEISPMTPPENLRAMFAYAREHKPIQ